MQITFDSPPQVGNSISEPSQDTIENTLNLRQVSLEDAVRFGGPITRQAIGAMNFRGDRKYIVVDTKVHMLLPGFIPSIPGWHTDGVPRGEDKNPAGKGEPNIWAQYYADNLNIVAPRYHLLVTGTHCPTRFLNESFTMDIDLSHFATDLYKDMTEQVNNLDLETFDTPVSTVVEWDWWSVHTAQSATARGWRYLIRVTETDYIKPRTDPNDFIRTQNQVYVPTAFGW